MNQPFEHSIYTQNECFKNPAFNKKLITITAKIIIDINCVSKANQKNTPN